MTCKPIGLFVFLQPLRRSESRVFQALFALRVALFSVSQLTDTFLSNFPLPPSSTRDTNNDVTIKRISGGKNVFSHYDLIWEFFFKCTLKICFPLILISRHDSMLVLKTCRGGESKTFKKKSSGCGIAVFSNVSSRVY